MEWRSSSHTGILLLLFSTGMAVQNSCLVSGHRYTAFEPTPQHIQSQRLLSARHRYTAFERI